MELSVCDSCTRAAVDAVEMFGADPISERLLLELAIMSAVDSGGGWIDSHQLTTAIYRRRRSQRGPAVSWDQTRDYVCHMLREARHVCRHADHGLYRVHAAATCSSSCTDKRPVTSPTQRRAVCGSCWVESTVTGHCPLCEAMVAVPTHVPT